MASSIALITAGLLMGLVGSPHCVGMCGAACSSPWLGRPGCRSWREALAFHLGRALSYAAGGALASGSLALLKAWSDHVAVLRPFWGMAQVAALLFGLWLLAKGRMPRRHVWQRAPRPAWQTVQGLSSQRSAWGRAATVGGLWVAWPCGLLHSGLLVASIAPTPLEGATVMLAFALGSGGPLWLGSRLLAPSAADKGDRRARWMTRLSGALLTVSATWSLINSVQSTTGFC
jgi:sulfite exporter TauE/SafE